MYLVCKLLTLYVNLRPQPLLCLCADPCKSGSATMVYRPMEDEIIHGICELLTMRQAGVTEAMESFLHVIRTQLHKASGFGNLLRQEVCQLKACNGAGISQAWQQVLSSISTAFPKVKLCIRHNMTQLKTTEAVTCECCTSMRVCVCMCVCVCVCVCVYVCGCAKA